MKSHKGGGFASVFILPLHVTLSSVLAQGSHRGPLHARAQGQGEHWAVHPDPCRTVQPRTHRLLPQPAHCRPEEAPLARVDPDLGGRRQVAQGAADAPAREALVRQRRAVCTQCVAW